MDIEIFRVGLWNGEKYVLEDLQEIVDNFERFKSDIRVPLKLGHDIDQSFLGQTDGDPAIGWVSSLRLDGNTLVATFDNVPDVISELMEKKAYNNVSSEIMFNVKQGSERVGKVLIGVALLGADIPAVSGLEELGAMFLTLEMKDVNLKEASLHSYQLKVDRSVENQPNNSEETSMTDEEKKELEDLRKEKFSLEQKLDNEAKENAELLTSINKQKFETSKVAFLSQANKLVEEKKITPAVRDRLEKSIDSQSGNYSEKLMFDETEVIEMLSLGSIGVDDSETATSNKKQDALENTPDVIAMNKAKAYVQEKKANTMHAALAMVYTEDKELADQVTLYKENPQKYHEMKGA